MEGIDDVGNTRGKVFLSYMPLSGEIREVAVNLPISAPLQTAQGLEEWEQQPERALKYIFRRFTKMTVTVEMTSEELVEFLAFRKAKQTDQTALNSVRKEMNDLAEDLLEAVQYDGLDRVEWKILNYDKFSEAVFRAIQCFA